MSINQDKQAELADLQARVAQLEEQIGAEQARAPFRPQGYYTGYYATTGFMLGIFGAMASLLFNVVGALFTGRHALELIRVYLTFPLGDQALEVRPDDNGLMLAFGCCLYLGTGMLLGIPVYLALTRWGAGRSLGAKFLIATAMGIIIWLVNFYGILSWLQPMVVKMDPKNLIVKQVPWYVAAATHLIFAWTMVLVYPLGEFTPYRRVSEKP